MKPGMASMAAVYKEKLILCLSGNPSAAFAAFCMVGRPVLHYMAGCREYRWKKCQVRLLKDFPKKSPSRRFIPGRLRIEEDGLWLDFSRDQGNGMIHQWDSYDFIGEIAPGTPPLKKGSLIKGYYYK